MAYLLDLLPQICSAVGWLVCWLVGRLACFAQLCEPLISLKIGLVIPKLTKFSITGDSFEKFKLSMIFLEASPRRCF